MFENNKKYEATIIEHCVGYNYKCPNKLIKDNFIKTKNVIKQDWSGVSIEEFIDTLNTYLVWYNEERIKNIIWKYET